jgi:hypothetical protein
MALPSPLALAALALGLLGASACDDPPSCEAVADHVAAVAAKRLGSTVEVVDRASLIRNCRAEASGNAEMRRCVVRATTLEDIKGCELRAALGR